MKHDVRLKETEQVVGRIMEAVRKYDHVGKAEFETILGKVVEEVHASTGIEPERIGEATDKVIRDMPNEYGRTGTSQRSWEAMIGYLYAKYLKELGVL